MRARNTGQNCTYIIRLGGERIYLNEVVDFNERKNSEVKTYHSVGETEETHDILLGNYELTFTVDMVDSSVSRLRRILENIQLQGRAAPKGSITEIVEDTEGFGQEESTWLNVTFNPEGKSFGGAKEHITQTITAMATRKEYKNFIANKNPQ